jgi:CHASE2 domain-containing sensor protein
LTTSANIQVLSVRRFCIAAILAGLLGVIVARQRRLFNQHPLLVLLELICAGAAAFLLYGMILAGMIPVPGSKEFMFGYLAASLVGLVGGYAGLGVFQLAKKILVH